MFEEELKKAREGDLKSIEEICSKTWKPLYRFVYYRVQNREETEDIVQETYVKALSGNRKIDLEDGKLIAFLKTVSMNILRDMWRKRKRRGASVNIESVNPGDLAVEDPAESGEQEERIKSAMQSLSEEQRLVVQLRIIKGYSAAETAKIMKKTEGNIRVIQYRALQNLASFLENYDRFGRE